MNKPSFSVLLLIVALAASLWLAAQQPGRLPGTIRVRVTEVPVDVMVLDRNNRPVLDLKKEDFALLENGVPQEIAHFSIESYVSPEGNEGAGATAPTPKPGSPAEPLFGNPHHRTFLIAIGQGRHRYFNAIPKLIEFIRTGLKPTDRVAFMAYNRATDFLTDHQKLVALLERYQRTSPSIDSKVDLQKSGLAAVYRRTSVLSQFQKEIDQIFQSDEVGSRRVSSADIPGRREQAAQDRQLMEAKTLLEMDKIAAANRPAGGSDSSPIRISEKVQTELMLDGMEFDEYMGLRTPGDLDLERLMAAIEYLRYREGEKHLIYLNDQGLPLVRLEHDQGLAAKASDARVRIHTIQTGGTYLASAQAGFSAASGTGPNVTGTQAFPGTMFNAFALQSAANAARLTGGQSFLHRDVASCLETVEKSTSSSYLLGYIPKEEVLDGRFRKIAVQVRRSGLRVLHRRGYYAERVLKPYDRKQFLTYSRTTVAAGLDELIHDVDFSLQANAVARSGSPFVEAKLMIRPAAHIYSLKDDRFVGQLAISYFFFAESGALLGETWDDLDMQLKPETHDRVLREGFLIEKGYQLPPEAKQCLLRVVIYDPANDRVGSAEAKLKLRNR